MHSGCNFYKERDMAKFISETLNEEKLIELWPEYLCLYDVRRNDFKDRDKREKAISEIISNIFHSTTRFNKEEEDAFPRYGERGLVKSLDKAAERPFNRSSLFLMHI